MSNCYSRLSITSDLFDVSLASYDARFVIANRQISLPKARFNQYGNSKDLSVLLLPHEALRMCDVYFNIYTPMGNKVLTNSLNGQVFRFPLGASQIDSYIRKDSEQEWNSFAIKTSRGVSDIIVNNSLARLALKGLIAPPQIPSGLRWVAYLRDQIKKSASKYGLPPQIVASIIFEEKYYGLGASFKDWFDYQTRSFPPTATYGFAEMQLGLAAKLLGIKPRVAVGYSYLEETFQIITTDPQVAIDLAAKHLALKQQSLGRKMSLQEFTTYYNGGEKAMSEYLKGVIRPETIAKSVYGRSWRWQYAIAAALEGTLVGQPDNCEKCNATIEPAPQKWDKNPSAFTTYF